MKISIITINFNNASGLEKTLKSNVALKSVPGKIEKEIIVIDGGSADDSVAVINRFQGEIAYSVSEKDRGIYHAMNKGVAAANGEFCIFMNSGDLFASDDVFEKIDEEARQRDCFAADVITGSTLYVDYAFGRENFGRAPRDISFGFFYRKTLQHQSSFIRTKKLREFPFDESLKIVGDIKFWLQCLILGRGKYIRSDVLVAKFDTVGVISRAEGSEELELRKVFTDLSLDRFVIDYDMIFHPKNLKMKFVKHFFSRALKSVLDL